jgi:DNA-binding beta-propeller fold protein YncE
MNLLITLLLATATLPHSPDLYVSGFFAPGVFRYYGPLSATQGARPAPGQTGATYARAFSRRPWGLAFGPDGNLYVASLFGSGDAIVRLRGPFNATPGVAEHIVSDGSFYDVAFGPDGNLYAASAGPIRRYDIVTGQLIDAFTKGHDLAETRGIAFGPDGNLYVSNYDSANNKGEIVRFDGQTGAFIDVYVPNGRGGLQQPYKLAFGPTGELFVANWTALDGNNILKFFSPAQSRVGWPVVARGGGGSAAFITRPNFSPLYIAFGPDRNLYVSDTDNSGSMGSVLRFNGATGAFIDVFAANIEGGPRGIAFGIGAQ